MRRVVTVVIAVAVSLACAAVARADITFSIGPVDPIVVRSGNAGPYMAHVSGYAADTANADLSISCTSTIARAELTVPSGTLWKLDLDVPFGASTIACTAAHAGVADEPATASIDVLVAVGAPLTVRGIDRSARPGAAAVVSADRRAPAR